MIQLSKEIQERAHALARTLKKEGKASCPIELFADQQAKGKTGILTTETNDKKLLILGSIKEAGVIYHIGVLP